MFEEETSANSLSRQAYAQIRDRIITLQLAPGTLLHEAALMEEFDLGRTPIREALQRLACEGLVVIRPRRGTFVANLGITDLQQIFELRQVLEGYATALAAERATEADLAAMDKTLEALNKARRREDPHALIEIDRAFHRALAQSAHNRFLEDTLSRMYNLNLRLWYLALDKIGSMRETVEQHRAVVEAIRRRDAGQAQAIVQKHISDFQARIKAII